MHPIKSEAELTSMSNMSDTLVNIWTKRLTDAGFGYDMKFSNNRSDVSTCLEVLITVADSVLKDLSAEERTDDDIPSLSFTGDNSPPGYLIEAAVETVSNHLRYK